MHVLLACRNGMPWLPEQVESILGQTGVTVSLSVLDDASSDESKLWLEALVRRDMRVSLTVRREGSGSAGAAFRCLLSAPLPPDAGHVALADQDDVWYPDKLRRAVQSLASVSADGYSAAVEACWPDGRRKVLRQDPGTTPIDFLFEGAGQGCTFVFSRRLHEVVRRSCTVDAEWVSRLHYHDWQLYLTARAMGWRWSFDPEPCMLYRQHGGNEIGARGSLQGIRRRLGLARSGWYRQQVLAASSLYARLGGDAPEVHRLLALMNRDTSLGKDHPSARWALLSQLFRMGRRKASDRWVLAWFALRRWL